MVGNPTIQEGVLSHLEPCCAAVRDSDLGRTYFSDGPHGERLEKLIREGLQRGEIRVALTPAAEFLGFIWFTGDGMFSSVPYIRLLAVKSGSRSAGIGAYLLGHAEDLCRARQAGRVFLAVAEFNGRAKQLYERLGYEEVALIPDLFYPGYAEHVLMKRIDVALSAP